MVDKGGRQRDGVMIQFNDNKQHKSFRIYGAKTSDILISQYRDPLLRHLTEITVRAATRYAPHQTCTKVLDIGCGVGRTSIALAKAGYNVTGVDPSKRAVKIARRIAQANPEVARRTSFHIGDAAAKPPPKWRNEYDLVVCSEVIEHIQSPERVIDYAHAVLRSGGVLILTTPHDRAQWTVMDYYAGHFTRFSSAELSALLTDFKILKLDTEGFPFQRLVMRAYNRFVPLLGTRHEFQTFGKSRAYSLYTTVMPYLLKIDHQFRSLKRGTTLVVVARRP